MFFYFKKLLFYKQFIWLFKAGTKKVAVVSFKFESFVWANSDIAWVNKSLLFAGWVWSRTWKSLDSLKLMSFKVGIIIIPFTFEMLPKIVTKLLPIKVVGKDPEIEDEDEDEDDGCKGKRVRLFVSRVEFEVIKLEDEKGLSNWDDNIVDVSENKLTELAEVFTDCKGDNKSVWSKVYVALFRDLTTESITGKFSGCFFLWCCNNLALEAYCLWHQSQYWGWIVTLPTVAEKVGFWSPGNCSWLLFW